MTSAACLPRPLESALFGIRITGASISAPEQVDAALRARALGEFDLLIARAPSSAMDVVQAIEGAGGRLCDVLVTLERAIPLGGLVADPAAGALIVREGRLSDASQLHQLAVQAFSGFHGHWHADPKLSKSGADELYALWASDLATRPTPGSILLVAQSDDREMAAFLAVAPDPAGTWSVPLTGVHPRHRGRGVLRQLLIEASRRIAEAAPAILHYETQLTNWPALRTVSRLDFVPVASRMTFHLWSTDR